ncbi:oligosaccharyltransferase complex subunit epsilon [Cryomyces antarcticus]|uniref:Dolichyl-diphosphooligosaccharide--protein glycosyltransferase subunit OST2 n=1 Tax=Cryomyces antarcticus TaxID=329879 RepID=A0ABR0KU16_9PEZI|nr:oligosaccharyltransferase complex subunit epsilon [Cryomyces antarcticus]
MAPKTPRGTTPAAVPPSAAAPSHTTTSAASQPVRAGNKASTSGSNANSNSALNTSSGSTNMNASSSSSSSSLRSSSANNAQDIVLGVWNKYVDATPQRVKLIDAFMAFLVAVGVLQFVYCVIVGNYMYECAETDGLTDAPAQPFNAFLSGFSATVGQFVLTASLRIQTNPENKAEFASISNER